MSYYLQIQSDLRATPQKWVVTGGAGFIGSHLTEALLKLDQYVVVLDDLSTGSRRNFDEVQARVTPEQWSRFEFIQGSVCDMDACRRACAGAQRVLHEAGFISVPLSIEDPLACNATNVDGFLNMLVAARDAGVERFVYASSSAVYGDDEGLPKIESRIGKPLSPYGTSKLIDELYADVFAKNYPKPGVVGLRYFNVFGPRQNPKGGYAAVIPKWISSLVDGEDCHINGDGTITRDFCHIDNIVQANILAAMTANADALAKVYNVALGTRTTLTQLYYLIAGKLGVSGKAPVYLPQRPGDILHSEASIESIRCGLGFEPSVSVDDGLTETVRWYAENRVF
jgi:UDP-N-acetylglucosamine 4-epimerase